MVWKSVIEMIDGKRRILWIHGWGMSPAVWEQFAREQVTGQGVEHHFFSYTDCHSIAEFHEALDRTLREVQPEAVIGWSMGGMLAIDRFTVLAEESAGAMGTTLHSLGIRRLIVVGSTLRFVSADRNLGWPRRIVERMLSKLESDPEAVLRQFADSMVSAEEKTAGKEIAVCGTDFSMEGLQAGLHYLLESDLAEGWAKTLVPRFTASGGRILWIHGREDTICPVGAAPGDAKGVRSVLLEGAGHAPFLTKPETFYEQLRGFLDDDED
ncbi:alpha/beta fold hydrolase [Paenibacillus sp. PvR148]